MRRLEGRIAIVTGGARGLGAGAVEALCADGARVVVADILDDVGEALVERLKSESHEVRYARLDVREADNWRTVVDDTLAAWDGIHCLVNNAGITIPRDISAATEADFRQILDINLIGTFLGIQAVVPAMQAEGGSIVNISSNSTATALPTTSMYGASKAAVAHLTKTTAMHCAAQGWAIRVNSVHPGAHATEMMQNPATMALPHVPKLIARIPMRRLGRPEEFGRVVAFLASDESSYMTGAELFTDGGLTNAPLV